MKDICASGVQHVKRTGPAEGVQEGVHRGKESGMKEAFRKFQEP
jgi:hypothetical protein